MIFVGMHYGILLIKIITLAMRKQDEWCISDTADMKVNVYSHPKITFITIFQYHNSLVCVFTQFIDLTNNV